LATEASLATPARPPTISHDPGCCAAAGPVEPLAISRILGNLLDIAATHSPKERRSG